MCCVLTRLCSFCPFMSGLCAAFTALIISLFAVSVYFSVAAPQITFPFNILRFIWKSIFHFHSGKCWNDQLFERTIIKDLGCWLICVMTESKWSFLSLFHLKLLRNTAYTRECHFVVLSLNTFLLFLPLLSSCVWYSQFLRSDPTNAKSYGFFIIVHSAQLQNLKPCSA